MRVKPMNNCRRFDLMQSKLLSMNERLSELDRLDLKILKLLQEDGRMSNLKLADAVGLSPTAVLARVQRLTRDNYILGYEARLNPLKLGAGMLVFVEVLLDRTHAERFRRVQGRRADPAGSSVGSRHHTLTLPAKSGFESCRWDVVRMVSSWRAGQYSGLTVTPPRHRERLAPGCFRKVMRRHADSASHSPAKPPPATMRKVGQGLHVLA